MVELMLRRQANLVATVCCNRGFISTAARRCALNSAALSAAERIANPSQATPASGPAGGVLSPDDPRVVWREHWCVAKSMPYYHNMTTNDTTWTVPDNFVTRFPTYHAQNSPNVAVHPDGRVTHRTGKEAADELPVVDAANLPLKKKLALYGSGGLILYLIIHNVFLFCVFTSMYFFGIDLVHIARSYGFNAKGSEEDSAEDDPNATKKKKNPTFVGTFVTAVLLNKMTVPLQLVITLTLAPRVVPKLQPLANRFIPKLKRMIPFLH